MRKLIALFLMLAASPSMGTISVNEGKAAPAGSGTGIIPAYRMDGSSVTLQGNIFNTGGRLLRLTDDGKYPALDGSQITGIAGGDQAQIDAIAVSTTATAAQLSQVAIDTSAISTRIDGVDSQLLQVAVDTSAISTRIDGVDSQLLQVAVDTSAIGTDITTNNGANQLVRLDGSSKLPAVDGSQLTGISAQTSGLSFVKEYEDDFFTNLSHKTRSAMIGSVVYYLDRGYLTGGPFVLGYDLVTRTVQYSYDFTACGLPGADIMAWDGTIWVTCGTSLNKFNSALELQNTLDISGEAGPYFTGISSGTPGLFVGTGGAAEADRGIRLISTGTVTQISSTTYGAYAGKDFDTLWLENIDGYIVATSSGSRLWTKFTDTNPPAWSDDYSAGNGSGLYGNIVTAYAANLKALYMPGTPIGGRFYVAGSSDTTSTIAGFNASDSGTSNMSSPDAGVGAVRAMVRMTPSRMAILTLSNNNQASIHIVEFVDSFAGDVVDSLPLSMVPYMGQYDGDLEYGSDGFLYVVLGGKIIKIQYVP